MALTKVTGQVINTTTDLVVGVTTVGGGISATDAYFSGITTLPNTTESTSTTTGSLIVSGGVGIAKNLSIGGSVSIGGTLTYEDVTNIDSVGLITARNGVSVTGGTIKVGSGITLSTDGDLYSIGVSTFVGVSTFKATSTFENGISVTGGHVHLNDSRILKLGTDTDAQIVHTGSYGSINNSTGNFLNDIAGDWYVRNTAGTENRIIAKNNGAVEIYHDNTKRFETYASGSKNTGNLWLVTDDDKALFGAGTDLQISHDGTDNIINNHSADLHIKHGAEVQAKFIQDGAVELYHDNTKRFETNSTGAKWVGNLYADDNAELRLGDDGDLQLFHNSASGEGRIYNSNAAGLVLISDLIKLKNNANNETMLQATSNGAVQIYYDNELRIATASAGVNLNLTSDDTSGTPNRYLNLYNDNNGANTMAGLRFAAASAANTDHWIYQKKHGAGNGTDLIVAHGSTERLRFVETGGFTFNGDTAAANALNDYEEGTFTPSVSSGLAGGSISYNSRSGRYTKIGNLVNFTWHMNIASCSLDSGSLKFGGLPHTAVANDGNKSGVGFKILTTGNLPEDCTFRVETNTTDILVVTSAGDAMAANSTSLDAGNRQVALAGFYYVP